MSNDANCDQFQFVKAPTASIMKETVRSTYHEIYKRGSTKQRRALKFAESWSCIAKFGAFDIQQYFNTDDRAAKKIISYG